jgi:hypothetical protein
MDRRVSHITRTAGAAGTDSYIGSLCLPTCAVKLWGGETCGVPVFHPYLGHRQGELHGSTLSCHVLKGAWASLRTRSWHVLIRSTMTDGPA